MNEPTKTVLEIGALDFTGNIIPHAWYQHLTKEHKVRGKEGVTQVPYLEAIILLSDICYWYRPARPREEDTGHELPVKKKFAADKLQRSYQQLSDQFGMGKDQVRNALKWLEEKGLLTLELREVPIQGMVLSNVLFIEPVPAEIASLQYPPNKPTDTPPLASPYPPSGQGIPPVKLEETYTETSQKNSQRKEPPQTAHTPAPKPEQDQQEPAEPDLPVVLEYEMMDESDLYMNCLACGASFAVASLGKSDAECPSCHYPVRVTMTDGKKLQPSQAARRAEKASGVPESSGGKWAGVSVNAFCQFIIKSDASRVKGSLRHQWAQEIRITSEEVGATPEQAATAIRLIGENDDLTFRTKSIQSPFEAGFKRLLVKALVQGVEGVAVDASGRKMIRQPGTYDERPGYYRVILKTGAIWVKDGEDPPGITMVKPRRRQTTDGA